MKNATHAPSVPGDGSDRGIEAWVFIDPNPAPAGEGPLAGLTCGIKDVIDVGGMPTRFGVDFHDMSPTADAPCVAALRDAGAAILGKTHTTAFAYLDPAPTRNPHDPARTPGGSSAGSAAAVAAGHVDFALGTQTVGSTLRPASFCGVVGFKPSYGRISTRGILPLAHSLDHVGIIARDVGMVTRVARVLIPSLTSAVAPERPLIAVDMELFSEYYGDEAHAALEGFAHRLADFADVVPRDFGAVARATLDPLKTIVAFEVAAALPFLRERDRPPEICALVRRGEAIDEDAYRAALDLREELRLKLAPLFSGIDALLTTCVGPAPSRETTGDARSQAPWSFFGTPSLTLPVGRSRDGLPIGAQLVAPAGMDAKLLALAERFEPLSGPF
ncbi:MAG TPA: amidase [Candidatus Dormibacteraeota bacterium]|nr:amidase [Candidatus Dormibacteraeota bacterium]